MTPLRRCELCITRAMCRKWLYVDCRLHLLANLHSRLLEEGQGDGQSRTALLAEARVAVQGDGVNDVHAAGELLVLLDREVDLLSRRAEFSSPDTDAIFSIRRYKPLTAPSAPQGPRHQLKPAQSHLQCIAVCPCAGLHSSKRQGIRVSSC